MPTIELEDHELRKLIGATHELWDYHHDRGNSGPAKEYRELMLKLHEEAEE